MPPETLGGADSAPPAIDGYASFWDDPQPATPQTSSDSMDAYAAFAVAADL